MYNLDEVKKKELLKYWVEASDYDFSTMGSLFRNKHYSWALFLGHLSVEKLLKAYYIKSTNRTPPYTHDLLRIILGTDLVVNDGQKDLLDMITSFNIKCRYDDYGLEFRKKCTKVFTQNSIKKIKEFRTWLKKKL